MFGVGRAIDFSYGHRLLNYEGKCARIHGHNGRVIIEMKSDKLNNKGMVMDFFEIKTTLGQWIQDVLDHRLILWAKDPAAEALKEKGEEMVLIDENPTAEALAKMIFLQAKKMKLPVSKITLWETENCFAVYHE